MVEAYPLLPGQARFLTRGLADEHHWNVARLFRVPPELTPDTVAAAFPTVANRHDGLRSFLRDGDRTERGAVVPRLGSVLVATVDLRGVPAAERERALADSAPRCRVPCR